MQEVKSLKNEVNEFKKSMEFTQNDLEERVNNVEENMCKVKKDLTEVYEYQIDPDYVNDSLKLRLRTIVCTLLSFVDKARILRNSHRYRNYILRKRRL